MRVALQNGTIALTGLAASVMAARLSLVALEARLGPLPTGSELLVWAFVVAAGVAAFALAIWSRRSVGGPGFALGLLFGYGAMLVAAALALAVLIGLFYPSGSYEKGGHERLLAGLLAILFITASGLLVAARVVGGPVGKNPWRIVAVAGLGIAAFLLSLVVLPAVFA